METYTHTHTHTHTHTRRDVPYTFRLPHIADIYDRIVIVVMKEPTEDFPGGPEVKTLQFHCRGQKFNPWPGKLRSCILHGTAKKIFNKNLKNKTKVTALEKDCFLKKKKKDPLHVEYLRQAHWAWSLY